MESDLIFVTGFSYLSSPAVALICISIIGVTFLSALFAALCGRGERYIENAPNLMTSMGIIGTFTGIVIGLVAFDVNQIDSSIPELLAGLKTAFVTSLVGMIAAVIFKALDTTYLANRREPKEVRQEVSPGQILNTLEAQKLLLIEVRDGLAKDSDTSLVGVIQRLRGDLRDRADDDAQSREKFHSRLFGEMQNFADLLSKSATEAVIEALKVVIQDFNKNLTEQFGDNFKRLDESVKKLVVWQDQYMLQLEAMSQQYAQGVLAIDATRDSVSDISENTAKIPDQMRQLQTVITTNQHQIEELQRHLEAFVTMRDKAIEAIPTVEKYLNDVGINLNNAANNMKVVMMEGAADFKTSVQQTNSALQSLANETQGQSEQVAETLQNAAERIQNTTHSVMENVEAGINNTVESVSKELEQAAQNLHEEITNQLDTVSHNLTSTADQMKSTLTEGAEKFTDSVRHANDSMEKVANDLQSQSHEVSENLKSAASELQAGWRKSLDELELGMSNTTTSIRVALERTAEQLHDEINKSVNRSLSQSESQISEATSRTNDAINKQLQALDEAMGAELTRVIGEMGTALAKISGQFAQDYKGLVSAMSDIVNQKSQRAA